MGGCLWNFNGSVNANKAKNSSGMIDRLLLSRFVNRSYFKREWAFYEGVSIEKYVRFFESSA